MKTILLATDFSESSKDAVHYGYSLACHLQANITLANAMIIPAEIPQSGITAWPADEFDLLMEDSNDELKLLKTKLEKETPAEGFQPRVHCMSEAGRFTDVMMQLSAQFSAELVVIGTHQGGLFSRFLIGDHAALLMDATKVPLLIVKPGTVYQPIKKIAYATEFKNLAKDLDAIYKLISFAKYFDAEILLAHISDTKDDQPAMQTTLADCLRDLSNKADYPHIYYRLLTNKTIEAGLQWLCENGQVDMLAMTHRSRNLLAELFGTSHTKNMNTLSALPLLVLSSQKA